MYCLQQKKVGFFIVKPPKCNKIPTEDSFNPDILLMLTSDQCNWRTERELWEPWIWLRSKS